MEPSVVLVGITGSEHPLVRDLVDRYGYQYHERPDFTGRDQFYQLARWFLELTADPWQPRVINQAWHGRGLSMQHLRLLRRLSRSRGVVEITLAETPAREFVGPDGFYAWDLLFTPVSAGTIVSLPTRPLPDGMLGSGITSRFLVIGEQIRRDERALDLPFFSDKASARYLIDALDEAGFREEEVLWMNALDREGNPNQLPEDYPRVRIALGQVASKLLARSGTVPKLDHSLPHPAFWRRFHAGERRQYVDALRRIRLAADLGSGKIQIQTDPRLADQLKTTHVTEIEGGPK